MLGIINFSWPAIEFSIPLAISIQAAFLSLFVIVGGILLAGMGISRLELIEDKALAEAKKAAKQEVEKSLIEAKQRRSGDQKRPQSDQEEEEKGEGKHESPRD